MNSFIENLENVSTMKYTENGARARSTTNSAVYDLFALGGAYRERSEDDKIQLFDAALKEDANLAVKCLFYLRDVRGGQGEREFFRVAYKHLAKVNLKAAVKNLKYIAEFGRWDDLIEVAFGSSILMGDTLGIIVNQLRADIHSDRPSLLAKWLPSENASSAKTKHKARILRHAMVLDSRQYRKMLTALRARIGIVESKMSANEWSEIEYDKLPSRAGFLHSGAFKRHDFDRYMSFVNSAETKVNAGTLYPYEIVKKIASYNWGYRGLTRRPSKEDEMLYQKYWENLPNYLAGSDKSILCVVDTSGSMTGTPINVAASLGIYCAERLRGDFHNSIVSFSERPKFIKLPEGGSIVDKVDCVLKHSKVANTNLEATFNLLKNVALHSKAADVPSTLVIISDMEIDRGAVENVSEDEMDTLMESIRKDWERAGLKMPHLVYWNVNGRNNTILEKPSCGVTFVSGFSPVLFESVAASKTGIELMLDKLLSDRYAEITA